jgi:hypothetical protein
MKKNLLLIASTMMLHSLFGQKIGIEQYLSYVPAQPIGNSTLVLIEHSHAIAEIRHDNEAPGVFSVNVGRSFSFDKEKFNTEIRPMIGIAIGPVKGINLNFDQEIELNRLYFSADLEYFHSPHCKSENYFFTWFESGIYFTDKLFGGVSLQANFADKCAGVSKGLVFGFSAGRWSFPVYVFEPLSYQTNIIAGIFYDMDFKTRSRNRVNH